MTSEFATVGVTVAVVVAVVESVQLHAGVPVVP
jgi:hypothetical protein